MTNLDRLFREEGQSPWLDNLQRSFLSDGTLTRLIGQGIRGVTSNPTIFQRAIEAAPDYDQQFSEVLASKTVEDAYWELVISDIEGALACFAPLHEESGGRDGFVSLEVSPALAEDTGATIRSARYLHERIAKPNLLVKIPATRAGVPAIHQMIAEGRSINVTLIFSLDRYADVIEAYISGLERFIESGGDPSSVHSVASFFISRVDTEADRRLDQVAAQAQGARAEQAQTLKGHLAVAQAKLAYQLFQECFSGSRWDALASRGANVQRPLWASTSTKNKAYADLLYVDSLIGPDTVNTMPDATVEAFLDHGTVGRTVDAEMDAARADLERAEALGVDMADVSKVLEEEGVAAFTKSFDELMQRLNDKAQAVTR
ncbi:MAG TPA: transaldolase [Acidimicrobiales bacterium]|nr:transaldolase [Acidimicrobiales bacterium]